jgi:tRNA(Ser,Leu) C12 N-acetylase TAN1
MLDWTVVATTREHGYDRGWQLLEQFGQVSRTDYFNVLLLEPDEPETFLDRFGAMVRNVPQVMESLSRVMPATDRFTFEGAEDFEAQAREIVRGWAPRLRGKSFHVRMHRRGFKGKLSSQQEERFLDEALLDELETQGVPGRIDFEDPDAVIDVETVDNRAGMSFWTREDLKRYPFLKVD